MKTFATIISLCLITLWCLGQTDSAHHKVYFAIIEHKSGLVVKSILSHVSDSSVYLVDKTGEHSDSVSYRDIEKIKIRRRGSVGTGITIGSISGAALGAIIGGVSYQKPDPSGYWITYDTGLGASIAGGIFLGGIGGLLTGAALGAIPQKVFKVHHDYYLFSVAVPQLKTYCLPHKN